MYFKIIFATFLWGSAFAGAKIGLQHADPLLFSGMRFVLAAIILIPVIFLRKVNLKEQLKHWRFMLVFAFLQTYIQYGLFFIGINKVPAATSAILVGSGPLLIAIMAHFSIKNDKMSFRKTFAIALGLTGVVFISLAKGQMMGNNPNFYIGVMILLTSTAIGGYTNIMLSKRKEQQISPHLLTAVAHFVGGILLLISSFIFEKPQSYNFPTEFWGALLWLAVISSAGFSIWYGLLNRPEVKVSELNMWKFLIPVFGTALSWLLVKNESPDYPTILGIVVITAALLLMQLPESFFRRGKL